jgi:large subunit ribosomal protein L1
MNKLSKKMHLNTKLYNEIILEKNDSVSIFSKIIKISQECKRNFNESVDIVVNLNINPKKDQPIRGNCTMPHGNGKKITICVFAEGKEAEIAKSLGAEIIGGEELINKIRNGDEKLNVNKCVATPGMMLKLTKIASILGKKGIMPNQKDGTITENIEGIVKQIKKGIVFFQTEKKAGNIQGSIGRVSFTVSQLEENFKEFINSIQKFQKNPKIPLIKSIYLSTTMGLSYKVSM